jgi:glycine C-acetyltransferase
LSPAITGATVEVLKILGESAELREKLMANTGLFRKGMEEAGFRIVPGIHPIVPVLFGHLPDDARLSQEFANALLEEGIYVIGFSYPVVPVGKARIRVQISAAHSTEQIEFALDKFRKVGQRLGAI